MKRKLLFILFLLPPLVIALYIFAYIYVGRSDAYVEAVKFLSGHKDLKSSIGEDKSFKLAYAGWGLSFLGPRGEAHFKIYVDGERRSGTAFVYLVSHAGQWKVRESNLFFDKGEVIPLAK